MNVAARNAKAEPATDPLARLLQAHPETAYDYLEFRKVMAGSAAALAAERATPEDLARLRACLEAMAKAHALDDPAQEAAADAEFHAAVVALGEVTDAPESAVCRDWSLYSKVASTSAGVELLRNEIVVLGNARGWGGDLSESVYRWEDIRCLMRGG